MLHKINFRRLPHSGWRHSTPRVLAGDQTCRDTSGLLRSQLWHQRCMRHYVDPVLRGELLFEKLCGSVNELINFCTFFNTISTRKP